MIKVCFVCAANSCRSQLAEALARHYSMGRVEVHSAGIRPVPLDSRVVQVMSELGIDTSVQRHKAVDPELLARMDLVVTLCSWAQQHLPPVPPRVHRLHWDIVDPVQTGYRGPEALPVFRQVRDELDAKIRTLLTRVERVFVSTASSPLH